MGNGHPRPAAAPTTAANSGAARESTPPEGPTAPGLALPDSRPLAQGEPLVEDLPSVDVIPLEDSASVEVARVRKSTVPPPPPKDALRTSPRGSVPPPLPQTTPGVPTIKDSGRGSVPPPPRKP